MRRAHECVIHNGVRETLTEVRSRYWITKGRSFVRMIVRQCVTCRRFEGKLSLDHLHHPYQSSNLKKLHHLPTLTWTLQALSTLRLTRIRVKRSGFVYTHVVLQERSTLKWSKTSEVSNVSPLEEACQDCSSQTMARHLRLEQM